MCWPMKADVTVVQQKSESNCTLLGYGRRSRERRSPLSEIVTDTPPIWQRDAGQPSRCAMVRPRHGGTPYLIEVTSGPGKYAHEVTLKNPDYLRGHSIYGAFSTQVFGNCSNANAIEKHQVFK